MENKKCVFNYMQPNSGGDYSYEIEMGLSQNIFSQPPFQGDIPVMRWRLKVISSFFFWNFSKTRLELCDFQTLTKS